MLGTVGASLFGNGTNKSGTGTVPNDTHIFQILVFAIMALNSL